MCDLPLNDFGFFLAIRKINESQNHSAIVFRGEDGVYRLLHLGWNFFLIHEDIKDAFGWVNNSLDASNSLFLSVMCDRIARRNPEVPYGLSSVGLNFDPETGEILPGPTGRGFTCATFILAIFRLVGLDLLVEDTWPEDANMDWQLSIVEALGKTENVSPEQYAAVKRDVGCRRFSPEEVVGSSSEGVWPVPYDPAHQLGLVVRQDLTSFYAAA